MVSPLSLTKGMTCEVCCHLGNEQHTWKSWGLPAYAPEGILLWTPVARLAVTENSLTFYFRFGIPQTLVQGIPCTVILLQVPWRPTVPTVCHGVLLIISELIWTTPKLCGLTMCLAHDTTITFNLMSEWLGLLNSGAPVPFLCAQYLPETDAARHRSKQARLPVNSFDLPGQWTGKPMHQGVWTQPVLAPLAVSLSLCHTFHNPS